MSQIGNDVFLSAGYDRKAIMWNFDGTRLKKQRILEFSIDQICRLDEKRFLIAPFMEPGNDGNHPKVYGKYPLMLFNAERCVLENDRYPLVEFKDYITSIGLNKSRS